MGLVTLRPAILLPLVVAAVLSLPRAALAVEPVVWRTDYNSARREAADKGLPLFVIIGTENCYYCKKLEAGPCRDALVVHQLAGNFIPLKIDASREPQLAKALRVQLYPTIVLAGPDGKIHAFVEGYIEADRLADHLKRAGAVVTSSDWANRDLEQANRALASSDYPRAVTLLRGIIKEVGDKAIATKAQHVLNDIERLATDKLARARELEQQGFTQEAMDLLAESIKVYAGTQSANDAASLMAGLAAKPEMQEKLRRRTARDMLAVAREDFRAGRYFDCLQKCEQLTLFSDLPEGKEGLSLAADVKGNPERLSAVCEQMNQRTALMYMTLADSWIARGQTSEAMNCYEKVMTLCPNSRQSDIAMAQITRLKANGSATPATLTRPNP